MKLFLLHLTPPLAHGEQRLVGVWATSFEFAYLPNATVEQDLGERTMADRRNPDWADWVDTLTDRSPHLVWWESMYGPNTETAESVLATLQDGWPDQWESLSEDDYEGPTREQGIIPSNNDHTVPRK